jgi:hypothetical protein
MDAGTDWVVSGGKYALDFDGNNDGVLIGTHERLNPTNYNVSLWFTPTAVTAGQKSIFSQIDATGNVGKAIRRNAAKLEFTVAASGSIYRVWTSNNTYAATLTHGVVSWDGTGTPRMWINGSESTVALAATSGTLPAPAAQPLYIGCDGQFGQASNLYNFAGTVHAAALWSTPLTAVAVSQLYKIGVSGMLRSRQRVSHLATQELSTTFVKKDGEWCETEKSYIKKNNVWVPSNPVIYTNGNWR